MSGTEVVTASAPTPGGAFSQGVRQGNVLAVAGQLGTDPATGKLADGVEEQTRQAIRNLEAVLAAGGGALEDVIQTSCFLRDISDFPAFDAAYGSMFSQPRPARATVGAQLGPGALVEVAALAVLRD